MDYEDKSILKVYIFMSMNEVIKKRNDEILNFKTGIPRSIILTDPYRRWKILLIEGEVYSDHSNYLTLLKAETTN